jgi:hypothetical protein
MFLAGGEPMVKRKSWKIALRRPGSATFSTFVKLRLGGGISCFLVEGPKKYYGYDVSIFIMLEI